VISRFPLREISGSFITRKPLSEGCTKATPEGCNGQSTVEIHMSPAVALPNSAQVRADCVHYAPASDGTQHRERLAPAHQCKAGSDTAERAFPLTDRQPRRHTCGEGQECTLLLTCDATELGAVE